MQICRNNRNCDFKLVVKSDINIRCCGNKIRMWNKRCVIAESKQHLTKEDMRYVLAIVLTFLPCICHTQLLPMYIGTSCEIYINYIKEIVSIYVYSKYNTYIIYNISLSYSNDCSIILFHVLFM